MKEKVDILISNYVDDEEILPQLIILHDKMDIILSTYTKLMTTPNIPNNKKKKKGKQHVEDGDAGGSDEDDEEDYDGVNKHTVECPICIESAEPGLGYVIPECFHTYCIECLSSYVGTLIAEGRVLNIKCPTPHCESALSHLDVQKLVTSDLYSKYDEYTFLMALKTDQHVKWCANPKGCGNAIYRDDDAEDNKVTCDVCKYEFCFVCNEPWHINTCQDYQQWRIDNGLVDQKFDEWKTVNKGNAKPCPNCNHLIEKNDGCNHMTCVSCHHEFCWLCLAVYDPSHWTSSTCVQYGVTPPAVKRRNKMRKVWIGAAVVFFPVTLPVYGGYRLHKWRKSRTS